LKETHHVKLFLKLKKKIIKSDIQLEDIKPDNISVPEPDTRKKRKASPKIEDSESETEKPLKKSKVEDKENTMEKNIEIKTSVPLKIKDQNEQKKKKKKKKKLIKKKKIIIRNKNTESQNESDSTKSTPNISPINSPISSPIHSPRMEQKIEQKQKGAWKPWIGDRVPLHPGSKPLPVGSENCLFGKVFIFTGTLDSTSRDDATNLIVSCGGKVTKSFTKELKYAIVGLDPGEEKNEKN